MTKSPKPKTAARYHHGDLRQALMQAATELLRQQGPNALSLRAIAKRAGVSHTAPYRHFADKDALLSALVFAGFDQLYHRLKEVQKNCADDPTEQLLKAGVAYIKLAVENPELTQLMFGGFLDVEKCALELINTANNAFQTLCDIVAFGIEADIYRSDDKEELALACWSMAHGLSMLIAGGQMGERFNSPQAIETLSHEMCKMLYQGMRKP